MNKRSFEMKRADNFAHTSYQILNAIQNLDHAVVDTFSALYAEVSNHPHIKSFAHLHAHTCTFTCI
jgi:hypothetical protein